MITKIAEYSIEKEEMREVVAAVKALLRSIQEQEPETLYMAFVRRDSTDVIRFIHLMEFSDEQADTLHCNAEYTKGFWTALHRRSSEEPCFTELLSLD